MQITLKPAEAKRFFFDRDLVTKSVDAADRRALNRTGGLIRKIAKQSLRKRKSASAAGQPPSSHVGLVKQLLYYIYDPSRKSVVTGPTLLNKGDPRTLELLEKGGTASRRIFVIKREKPEKRKRGRPVKGSEVRFRSSAKAPARNVRYPARPFMGPAYEKAAPQLPAFWASSVK